MRRLLPYLLVGLAACAIGIGSHYSDLASPYLIQLVVDMGIAVILASSLNLINGFTGQFSLGHAGFMAVGAYVSAACTYYLGGFPGTPAEGGGVLGALAGIGIPAAVASPLILLVALLMAGVGAATAGLLVGLPTLRLRGDYLAIATLGFGEIVRVVISQVEAVGGPRGFTGIPRLTSVAWVAAWAAITLVFLRNLLGSSHGRAFVSVREDEVAAAAVGVNTTRYKVLAFTIGAFFAGVAGCLFAHYRMTLHPGSFTFIDSVKIVVMVVLGGMGSLAGSAAAAIILTLLLEVLRTFLGAVTVAYCFAMTIAVLPALTGTRAARVLGVSAVGAAGLAALMTLVVGEGDVGVPWIVAAGVLSACCALASCWIAGGRLRVRGAIIALTAISAFLLVLVGSSLLPGPLLAAKEWVQGNVSQLRLVIYAALLVGLMLTRPTGLLGGQELSWRLLRSLCRPRRKPLLETKGRGLAAS